MTRFMVEFRQKHARYTSTGTVFAEKLAIGDKVYVEVEDENGNRDEIYGKIIDIASEDVLG